ncbi:hypothetical protein NA8A_18317 [Nitratireductor indicus C115]|uniref:Uncharacterized protein n=1 Tax=Nitratireductor indicus C115 TaxID=1231190 RepID=K2N024_9HYPH|nr:hypothetical protein [Nitratireductor indicus]EKF40873.1 hypothetical protein NA8A_18317 [Nitratireductor indicus C115]SFQ33344.1 hypothetical protein SAMN05216176_102629 [Nitratireductor indicus]
MTREQKLEEALRRLTAMRKGIEADVSSAHSNRGNGASEWMREDDRDFRRELCEAFDAAHAALTAGEEAEVLREMKSDADLIARLKAIAVDVFPSANKYAVSAGVENIIRILEHIDPDEYAALHRAMYPFSYTDNVDGQPTEAQEWQDYDPDC